MTSQLIRVGPHVQGGDLDKAELREYMQGNQQGHVTVLDLDIEYYHNMFIGWGMKDVSFHCRTWALIPRERGFNNEDLEKWAEFEANHAVEIWQRYGRPYGGLVDSMSVANEILLESFGGRPTAEAYKIIDECMFRLIEKAEAKDPSIILYHSGLEQPWYKVSGPNQNSDGFVGMYLMQRSIERFKKRVIYHGYTNWDSRDAQLDPTSWHYYYECFAHFRKPLYKDQTEGVNENDPGGSYLWLLSLPGEKPSIIWKEFNCNVTDRAELISDFPDIHTSQWIAKRFFEEIAKLDPFCCIIAFAWFEWTGGEEFVTMWLQGYKPTQDVWKSFNREIQDNGGGVNNVPVFVGAMLTKVNKLQAADHSVEAIDNERPVPGLGSVQPAWIDGIPETLVYVTGSGKAVVLADKFPL